MNSEELKKKYSELAKNSLVQVQYSCSGNSSSFCEFEAEAEETDNSTTKVDSNTETSNKGE